MNTLRKRAGLKGVGDLLMPVASVDNGVILSRDGALSATWKFRGPDMASETHHHMAVMSERLNQAVGEIGDGWMWQIDAIRSAAPGYCPEGHFPDITTRVIDAERRQQFLGEGQHYVTEYFLTMTYLPPPPAERRVRGWLFEGPKAGEKGEAQKALDQFSQAVSSLEARLRPILNLSRLKSRSCGDDFDVETVFDEQLRFFRRCIAGVDHPFVRPDIPLYLNDLLCPKDFVGGLAPRLGRRHIRVIAVEGFPKGSYPGILDQLGHLPMEYRWNTRAILLDRESAIRVCDKVRAQWQGQVRPFIDSILQRVGGPVNLHAQEMVQDAEQLRAAVASGEVRLVHYSGNFICMDEDLDRVEASAGLIVKTIQALGFGARVEDVNAVEALLGTFPADGYRNVRRSYIHTLNLSDLLPTTALWSGLAENPSPLMPPHSPPLLYGATNGSTPFRLNLHAESDVGHTVVVGPVGAGKSTLLALLAAQWRRYERAQVFVFDKGYSMYVLTKAAGGEFYDIGGDKTALSFCPLHGLDTATDVNWAAGWLEVLCMLQGLTLTPEQRSQLTRAVARSSAKPSPGLTEFCTEVQDVAVREALSDYTLTGSNGHLLDAQDDMLGQGKFVTFEMQHLMGMGEKAVVPVLLYLFRQIEKRLDGSPTLVILDEAWIYLKHDLFRERVREWLKVLRKENAVVVLATQTVSDIYNSPIRDVVLESCPTKILLPNTEALNPASREFYDHLGLNDREIEMVQRAQPKRDYYTISPLGRRMISLGLGKVALSFLGVNGRDQRQAVEKLMETYPDRWQSEWLKERGLADWARFYEECEAFNKERIA
ncbi:MAG: conjugal transfer protein TrbE [Bryobacteraceae bacterium]|jgi:type IV secretion system protein VirB4